MHRKATSISPTNSLFQCQFLRATVAERINEYAALGIDSFIFSGYPHLEEAYRVGELLFPLLDVAVPSIPQPQNLRLQGEAVANEFIPRKVAQS